MKRLVERLFSGRLSRFMGSRNFAEELDHFRSATYTLAYYLERLHHVDPSTLSPAARELTDLIAQWKLVDDNGIPQEERMLSLSALHHRQLTCAGLDYQLRRIFEHVQSTGPFDPYPAPLLSGSGAVEQRFKSASVVRPRAVHVCTPFGQLYHSVACFGAMQKNKLPAIQEKPILHPDGFQMQIKHSTIDDPDAGFGSLRLFAGLSQ